MHVQLIIFILITDCPRKPKSTNDRRKHLKQVIRKIYEAFLYYINGPPEIQMPFYILALNSRESICARTHTHTKSNGMTNKIYSQKSCKVNEVKFEWVNTKALWMCILFVQLNLKANQKFSSVLHGFAPVKSLSNKINEFRNDAMQKCRSCFTECIRWLTMFVQCAQSLYNVVSKTQFMQRIL